MPMRANRLPIQPFSQYTAVRAIPAMEVGSAKGRSMSPSMILRPGNRQRTNTQLKIRPNTPLMAAAMREQPKLTL